MISLSPIPSSPATVRSIIPSTLTTSFSLSIHSELFLYVFTFFSINSKISSFSISEDNSLFFQNFKKNRGWLPCNSHVKKHYGQVRNLLKYRLKRIAAAFWCLNSAAEKGCRSCSSKYTRYWSATLLGTLRSGIEVAVKPLSAESRQGLREFLTEVETISDVTHPNLVELIGYCLDGNNWILVYENLENRSLDRALFGLAYLHEELVPHIVHRDIKTSNILLDKDYKPKIGDFGLAKLFPHNITHITTQIKGTNGYLAPEYVIGRQLTFKADVYSFGVLILDTVSGRSSGSGTWQGQKLLLESLVAGVVAVVHDKGRSYSWNRWAWQLHEEGKLLELVDPELGDFPEKEVLKYMKVALFCTQENANRRPMMSQVLDMLSRNIKLNEKELTPPGFYQVGEFYEKK